MLRILFDEEGDGHSDLFVKVDSMVSSVYVADSYFLHEMYPGGSREENIVAFLKDLQQRFANLVSDELAFIPFGYFDQCLEGFFVKKQRKGLIRLKVVSTENSSALNYNPDDVLREFQTNENQLFSEDTLLISGEAIKNGLDWSIQRIQLLRKESSDGR